MGICDLDIDSTGRFICACRSHMNAVGKNGASYNRLSLSDKSGNITAFLWNTSDEEARAYDGQAVDLELHVKLYNEKLSYEIRSIKIADGVSAFDIASSAPENPSEMYGELVDRIARIRRPLGDAVLAMLSNHRDELMFWAAAKSYHHDFAGGLLYHTIRMVRCADAICDVYGEIDRDMVIAGTAIHDLGKLTTYDCTNLGDASINSKGELLGHLACGVEEVGRIARSSGCCDEEVMLLQHIVAAHHGRREWGALVEPHTLEAYIVHMVDTMDARMNVFERTLNATKPGQLSLGTLGINESSTRVYRPLSETEMKP